MRTLLDRGFLIDNLCWFYQLMVASAPLLEFAISKLGDNYLREYYSKHLTEEVGHDEMLRNDLLLMGVQDFPRSMSAARLAGSQYYLIAHHHPAMLLGYMQALESRPPKLSLVQELELHHKCTLQALRHHAIHDPHHAAELEIQIVGLPYVLLQDVIANRTAVNLAVDAEIHLWQEDI